ncbi:MAG: SDR family oxidoreductase [Armatimonadetes bacterium]|nr:SDR family oxidoreductase [Armatimonadota bacterium]
MDGRVALVIGGTASDGKTSIGAAIARFLAEEGAVALPTSRNRLKVEKTVEVLHSMRPYESFPDIDLLSFDARDDQALISCCNYIEDKFGPISILVNAQGIITRYDAVATPRDQWESILSVNVLSVARSCQIVGGRMIQRRAGHIVNIASETSLRAIPYVSAYGTSKGAVRLLTAHLGCEWARYNVCVNAIAPGVIVTELNRPILEREPARLERFLQATPAQRLGTFEDLRAATIFLTTCTPYVTGITVPVDGGMSAALFAPY